MAGLQMASPAALSLERKLAATLDWWRGAGVDCTFEDEPRGWLPVAEDAEGDAKAPGAASLAGPSPSPAPPPPPAIGGSADGWPRDLTAFSQWWLTEPSLELGGAGPRLAPRGVEGARLMVLVPMPEAADRDALLSGREGRLIGNMLAAMGIAPAEAYLAAALPRHMAHPDWERLDRAGLGAIARHHLALARPARLLVLGHSILPLLGHDRAQGPATIKQSSIQVGSTKISVPTLAGFAPGRLLENARQRALLWRQWLDWTEED